MNAAHSRSAITLLAVLILLVTAATTLHYRTAPPRSAGEPASPVLPAGAYSDLVNGLTMGGR